MPAVHHRYATVQGRQLFFREAGPSKAPTLVLPHGFPASSFMFRNLIPALSDHYHVIAPDHLGFGLSAAPAVHEFDYTFDALASLTAGLLDTLGVGRYAIYVSADGEQQRSRRTRPAPRSICSTGATSSWRALATGSRGSSANSSPGGNWARSS